jgi:hypothetical protein
MDTVETQFSRISKLFADRDETAIDDALARRRHHAVILRCGADLAGSYTLQLAVLTAANIASRCFPGAVRIALEPGLAETQLLVWPSLKQTFGQALADLLGLAAFTSNEVAGHTLVFGNAVAASGALRVTFDGWIAKAGPATLVDRMAEREYCPLAGVLAGALAISELFLAFADISIQASRRVQALSLWRPDLEVSDPAALGVRVEFLPRDLWILGLGHLGNAYLWSLGTLPYREPGDVSLYLNDFDKVEDENIETSLLLSGDGVGRYKTRACSAWLEKRGFQTRLIERPFDGNFRCRGDEPKLALCGFDSNPPRRHLATAQFLRVVESGLGGTANNFDTISLHALPNPRPADDLWPDLAPDEDARRRERQEQIARQNSAYARIGGDECGRYELAGKSIAVPFVGTTAATLVVAETLRLLHGGPGYTDIKLAMATLHARSARTPAHYAVRDLAGLNYSSAQQLQRSCC